MQPRIPKNELNYISALNLNRDPFAPEPDLTFFYEYESLEKCYAVLNRLVQGDEILVLVIGEAGSGKTLLLKRYLTASIAGWKTGRIRIQTESGAKPGQTGIFNQNAVDSYPAYFLQDIKDSIIIIDDAHKLSARHLTYVLKDTQMSGNSANLKRFILLGEPQLIESVNALTAPLGNGIAISKIFLPPMTREQTGGYLNYRLAVAGYIGKRLFSASAVKKIHRLTGGLPGRINTMADQQLKENFSEEKPERKGTFGWMHKYEKALNWSAAGVAVVFIALFVAFYYSGKQITSPHNPGLAQRVYRAKIDLPAGFEKTQPLVAETRSSEKQTPDSTTVEIQTSPVPAIGSPQDKTMEIASPPPEVTVSKTQATSEDASAPESASAPRAASEKENIAGKAVYREKWLLSQKSSDYTIQILGVHDKGRLLNFIENDLTQTQTNLAYYQTTYKGRDWYPLLYGIYASQQEASAVMKQLPAHIQKSSPWIRRLSSVQKAIQKQTKP